MEKISALASEPVKSMVVVAGSSSSKSDPEESDVVVDVDRSDGNGEDCPVKTFIVSVTGGLVIFTGFMQ